MKLGTTTWRKRNTGKLESTKAEALKMGITEPILIEYGPGATVKNMMSRLPEGKKTEWSAGVRIKRIILKFVDGMMRKTNMFAMETSEPEEIMATFADLNPKRFHVVDLEKRVLQAVQDLVAARQYTVPFEYHQIDLNKGQLDKQGDIVIAYNVAKRTNDPEASLHKIAQSCRVGGLLTTGAFTTPRGFEEVAHGVYRRIE